jgi:hypothetical protein
MASVNKIHAGTNSFGAAVVSGGRCEDAVDMMNCRVLDAGNKQREEVLHFCEKEKTTLKLFATPTKSKYKSKAASSHLL